MTTEPIETPRMKEERRSAYRALAAEIERQLAVLGTADPIIRLNDEQWTLYEGLASNPTFNRWLRGAARDQGHVMVPSFERA